MKLICNQYETPDQQCIVVEDNIRCLHGVRNRKRGLCSTHYARQLRNGSPYRVLPNGGSLPKTERIKRKEAKNAKREALGLSTICFCAHVFLKHDPLNGCKVKDCKCDGFDGTNPTTFYTFVLSANKMGFDNPLNDTIECLRCHESIKVGSWHDQLAMGRMREHLKIHLLERRNAPRVDATG